MCHSNSSQTIESSLCSESSCTRCKLLQQVLLPQRQATNLQPLHKGLAVWDAVKKLNRVIEHELAVIVKVIDEHGRG